MTYRCATRRTMSRPVLAAVGVLVLTATAVAPVPAAAASPARQHPTRQPSEPVRTWEVSRLRPTAAADRPLPPDERRRREDPTKQLAQAPPPIPDIDGNGLADLLVQSSGPDTGALRVYADSGDPWSSTSITTSSQWAFADLVTVADVTGDGRADVIARDPLEADGTLWVYPNTGDRGDWWTTRFQAGTGWNLARTLLVGDVSGDGLADLVVRDAQVDNGTIRVYRGNGSTASNPWTSTPIWSGNGWNTVGPIMLADATGDQRLDIIARTLPGDIYVYPHNGATSSNYWTSIVVGSTGWSTTDKLTAVDATGDGRPDLLTVDSTGRAWLHPQLSASAPSMWSPQDRREVASGLSYAAEILPADLDGNGRPELSARVAPGGDLSTLPHNGDVAGNPWTARVDAGTGWGFASQILLGDVDGDRHKDLLVLDDANANGTLWIYRNTGSADNRFPSRYFAGTGWNIFAELVVGDVNGDDLADLVGRNASGELYAYPGNGSTTSFPWQPRVWVGSNWQRAHRLALGDLDGDGIDDLVDLEQDGSLWLFPTGTSTDPVSVPGDWAGTVSLGLGDTTGGGRLDLVVRDDTGTVRIYGNDGRTTGNPWTVPARFAGSGFGSAQSFAL